MGQVNVNTPGGGPPVVEDGSGYGFIVGILVAIVIIALLVYFLVLRPGGTTPANNTVTTPAPSAWLLVDRA